MWRDLQTKLYDGDGGIAGGGANPSASARGRSTDCFGIEFTKKNKED